MYENQTAAQQIVKTILSGIKKGTFKLGQKIPSQRELSEQFGVSRMVIREAIKILEGKGILYSKMGSGIYVQSNEIEPDNFMLGGFSDYNLADVLSLSNEIWVSSIRLVVKHATDEEINDLNQRVNEMYQKYNNDTTLQEKFIYESSFGMTLCKLTHNNLLYRLMVEMLKVTSDTDYQVVKNNGDYKNILKIDHHLLEALIARDVYRAQFWANERNIEVSKISKKNNII